MTEDRPASSSTLEDAAVGPSSPSASPSASDAALDRLACLAARSLKVPQVLIASAEGARPSFRGAAGSAEPGTSRREAIRLQSFVRQVVEAGRPLAVEAARLPPPSRADDPNDGESDGTAYLGMPLVGPEGRILGALGAADRGPRAWADADREMLRDLAEAAAEAVGLRLALERARREARAEAEAGERRYRALADAVPQLVYTARPDGWDEFFNRRWYDYTGTTLEQCQGEGWSALLHPDDRRNCLDRWALALRTGEVFEAEYRLRRASDGDFRWFLGRALPVRDDEGRVVKWFGTCTDIDDQKQAERAMAAQSRRREALAELGRMALEGVPPGQLMDEVVARLARILDVEYATVLELSPGGDELGLRAGAGWPEGLVGRASVSTDPRTQAGATLASLSPIVLEDQAAEAPFCRPTLPLEQSIASGLCVPIPGRDRPFGVLAVHSTYRTVFAREDVDFLEAVSALLANAVEHDRIEHQREEAIDELQWNQTLLDGQRRALEMIARGADLRETLEAIVRLVEEHAEGTLGSILLLDRDGVHLRHGAAPSLPEAYNRAVDGVAVGEGVGSCGTAVHRRAPVAVADIAADPLWDGHREVALRHGLRACWSSPVLAEDGEVLGTLAMYDRAPREPAPRDWKLLGIATQLAGVALERRRAERERARLLEGAQAARSEAEKANRAKDQFLAVLSHELRTPLTPVLVTVTAMLDELAVPDELRSTMEMIRRSVELEARLIDDLLDVTRIVRGKMPLNREPVDAHVLIRQTTEICRSDLYGGRIRLLLDLSAEHATVDADPARLQQVFWNLIKNAVKFTPAGGTVSVSTSNPGGPGLLAVAVADTGIGIDADALGRIFNAFEQGEISTTRRFGGLGLGLAISRSVVQAHGGTLVAESPGRGRGATFRVELRTVPAPAGLREHAPAPSALPSRPLSILLVEDDRDTLKVMTRVLQRRGHRVCTASDLRQGIALGESGDFDLIISDIGLPDGTGHDLMRHLRRLRPVTGIALTGFGMDDDIRKSREAGFSAHLTKPIDFPKLEAIIQQVAPPTEPA